MKIFIDGSAGTTGLRIKDRLMKRSDVELLTLGEKERKDPESRKRALNGADAAFLCLPDSAAVEAVGLVENPDTVIIDTSTAHRTAEGWAYGFPELSAEFEEKIKNSKRIAVPGCHAGGFIALVYPLVEAGVLKKTRCSAAFPSRATAAEARNDSRIRERGQIAPAVRPEAIRAFSTAQAPKGDGGHNRN